MSFSICLHLEHLFVGILGSQLFLNGCELTEINHFLMGPRRLQWEHVERDIPSDLEIRKEFPIDP